MCYTIDIKNKEIISDNYNYFLLYFFMFKFFTNGSKRLLFAEKGVIK